MLVSLSAMLVSGCAKDSTGIPSHITADTYFGLVLNYHALNMSLTEPANTVQLTATPVNADGAPLSNIGTIQYEASDSSVSVTSTGLVTARYVTPYGGSRVIASLQYDGVTYADTAVFHVTETAPAVPIKTLSIQPSATDSAFREIRTNYLPVIDAKDVNGDPVPFNANTVYGEDNYAYLSTSNPSIAAYEHSFDGLPPFFGFDLRGAGTVTISISAWVYGVSVQDSLRLTVGWPSTIYSVLFESNGQFNLGPLSPFVGEGGTVQFLYGSGSGIASDIIFDDSLTVDSAFSSILGGYSGAGNIHFPVGDPGGVQVQVRSFPKAGNYHFYIKSDPSVSGTIYVRPQPH
jgi:hypothetical protein